MRKLKLFSTNNKQDAVEDIDSVSAPTTTTTEIVPEETRSSTTLRTLPEELTIHIATFLPLNDLSRFSRSDSHLLLLLFNQTPQSERTALIPTKIPDPSNDPKLSSEESDKFTTVQNAIWKRLVCYYFPTFQETLNIKNWMHVLRRRIAHLKIHHPLQLPLTKNMSSDLFKEKHDPMIEGCEWIYKCPLSFNKLKGTSPDIKFCDVCQKNVYNVKTKEELIEHANQGHCIAYNYVSPKLKQPVRRMGSCLPPQARNNTTNNVILIPRNNANNQ